MNNTTSHTTQHLPFPQTVGEFLAHREAYTKTYGKDAFAFAVTYKASANGHEVVLDESAPLVVQHESLKQQYPEATNLPTRKQVNSGQFALTHTPGEQTFLLGSGAVVEVEQPNQPLRVLTLRRDANAPTNPNTLTYPAGVADDLPAKAAMGELAQETGLVVEQNGQFARITFVPPTALFASPAEHTAFAESMYQETAQSLPVVQHRLSEKLQTPVASMHIQPVECHTQDMSDSNNPVQFTVRHNDGTQTHQDFKGFLAIDEKNHALNLNQVVRVHMPENAALHMVDPEEFNRETGLKTVKELAQDTLTPSFLPYVDKALLREQVQEVLNTHQMQQPNTSYAQMIQEQRNNGNNGHYR